MAFPGPVAGDAKRLRVLAMTFNMNRKQQIFKMEQIFSEPQ
jgi:hypothetical protein